MSWTLGDYARAGVSIVMLLGAVAYIEHRRAAGKLPQGVYSFRAVRQVVGGGLLVAVVLAGLIYAWTGSADSALGLGGIMIGVILVGSLRGFLNEYHLKKNDAKNSDRE